MFKIQSISNFLFLLVFMAALDLNSQNNTSFKINNTDPAVVTCIADKNSFTLKWFPHPGKNVIVIAKPDGKCIAVPQMDDKYIANNVFGKGSEIGGGSVVYKGDGSSVTVRGLKPGKKYYFHLYEIDAEGRYTSDKTILEESQALEQKQSPNAPSTVVMCACPPIAGVTCSVTGTTNTGTSVASAAGCPHVGYCDGPGVNNPWTSVASTGVIQYMFSSPVSAATLRANSVNVNDYATISSSGGSGGSLSISGVVCMSVSGLIIGPLTVASSYGGVSWTVNSTGSYTMITATNTGAQSGWVAACPTAITPVALPIELVSLRAECSSAGAEITWQTSSEKNNSYFSIERSYDTENWESVGNVAGAGNSYTLRKYSFTDKTLSGASAYYRLKQVDLNSKFKLSEMVSVRNCDNKDVDVNIYPNPARNEVMVKSGKNNLILEIYNVLGKMCGKQELVKGDNSVDVSKFPNGTYFFRTSGQDSEVNFTKVIVNN